MVPLLMILLQLHLQLLFLITLHNVSVYSDGNSNSKLTLTDFGCFEINILAKDSTNYYIWGYAEGADVPAFADQ
jgi:hypothetical protein